MACSEVQANLKDERNISENRNKKVQKFDKYDVESQSTQPQIVDPLPKKSLQNIITMSFLWKVIKP